MSYGSWSLDHPIKAVTLVALLATLGGGIGVLVAWLLTSQHALSPDNVLAGAALGFGGAMAGMLAAFAALRRIDAAAHGT